MLKILLICRGNSCRSILGEALFNHIGKNRIQAYSAGSHPKGRVNDKVISILKQQHIPTDALYSKPVDAICHHQFDIVISICKQQGLSCCADESGINAKIFVNWDLFEPSHCNEFEIPAPYQLAFNIVKKRIKTLLSLPLESLSQQELTHQLMTIGKINTPS